jgi:tRNA(fMet)-specific endonuclease VapC
MAKRQMASAAYSAIENFLAKIDISPWDSAAAQEYGALRAQLESMGKPLANMDLLIAAHAVAMGAVLVTNDHVFKSVPSLTATISWADDLRT